MEMVISTMFLISAQRIPLAVTCVFIAFLLPVVTHGQGLGRPSQPGSETRLTIVDTMYFDVWRGRAIPEAKNHLHNKSFNNAIGVNFFLTAEGNTYDVTLDSIELEGYSVVPKAIRKYYSRGYRPPPSLMDEFDIRNRAGQDHFRIIARFDTTRIEREKPPERFHQLPPHETVEIWNPDPQPTYEGGYPKLFEVAYELYPDSLTARGLEGDVIIGYTVSADYKITDVVCLQERPKGFSLGLIGVQTIEQMRWQQPEGGKEIAPPGKYQQVIRYRVRR